jgi:membrane-bound serine protease (ClpP class)
MSNNETRYNDLTFEKKAFNMKKVAAFFLLFTVLLAWVNPPVQAQAQGTGPTVIILTADGALTPVMAGYIERGIKTAEERQAELIVLQLNTPGGSIDLMNRIVQDIRGSAVPVVVYVAPAGAMAGSAGTVITLAGHLDAMAPDTAIGAASPVGSQGEDIGTTEETKVKEILKATVRSLTERRPPQAVKLAEDAIDHASAASASEALSTGLVDFKANSLSDLLQQLNGVTVAMPGGSKTLHINSPDLVVIQYSLIEQLLQMLTDPNLVFILLSVGVQAVLIELSNPGGWVPGFIGAVCLLLAVYGLGILPVNWFGLIFIVMAFVLFLLEIKTPTHGALTVAGAVSFIMGALVLFNTPTIPAFQRVSVPLVIGMGVLLAGSFFAIVTFALRAQRLPVRTGREALLGRTGFTHSDLNPKGKVQIGGELWNAELEHGTGSLPDQTPVEVIAVEGLRLIVRPINPPK